MFISIHRRHFLIRLAFALVVVAVFTIFDLAIDHVLHRGHSALFLAATVIASLNCGVVVGVISAFASFLIYDYFFQLPRYSLSVNTVDDLVDLTIFLATALLMSWVGGAFRRALLSEEEEKEKSQTEKRAREDVLAVVSHDMRNPIAAINMNAQLILRRHTNSGTNELTRLTAAIQYSVDQMSRLIQDLLDFERLRSGVYSVQLKDENVESLLREAFSMMQPIAKAKNINLKMRCDPPQIYARCDSKGVFQVLSNLLGNSLKFTKRGGTVEVTAELRENEVLCCVRDTGPGIPGEQISHIFDRYWQAKNMSRQGTGLGLAIARGIIEAHGGRIWAKSEVGRGTQVYFTLKSGIIRIAQSSQETLLKTGS